MTIQPNENKRGKTNKITVRVVPRFCESPLLS